MRTYDKETRGDFIRLLRNAIRAINQGEVHNAFDVGTIAMLLKRLWSKLNPTKVI